MKESSLFKCCGGSLKSLVRTYGPVAHFCFYFYFYNFNVENKKQRRARPTRETSINLVQDHEEYRKEMPRRWESNTRNGIGNSEISREFQHCSHHSLTESSQAFCPGILRDVCNEYRVSNPQLIQMKGYSKETTTRSWMVFQAKLPFCVGCQLHQFYFQ